ncbi:D-TA family PLP-dependent enzyme [Muriicola soli]|uniref:D-TA family PLP-dependent enzyme n=1 Tax=Muriicola soli TaxID=2507538 RepID=A0A411EBH1_9FLAO|nr:D-TA family PLP-dependent enzyme [Muriicola soli]QBA65081.1 D-TA family PLP-dependent enzyme [Muriicola soli]
MITKAWYRIDEEEQVFSPNLLIYPSRIEQNIQTMVNMVGDPSKLRPHIKTHKMAEVIQLQIKYGITKFKCATIAEAELLGLQNAADVLLAMQPVGPNILRFYTLISKFPQTKFSTLVDNEDSLNEIEKVAKERRSKASLYLDLNVGMDRTGVKPGKKAAEIFRKLADSKFLEAAGLHVYDGHIRHPKIEDRERECDAAFKKVLDFKHHLETEGYPVPEIIAGGSPTFPIHAKRQNVISSPGTTLLWDARYGGAFKDMDFIPAAVLISRVISKPAPDIFCLDLGHKAVAPEMDFPRVHIYGLEDCEQISQSEEHLVLRSTSKSTVKIGQVFYAVPIHVCPTVAKYPEGLTVEGGKITGKWKVAARNYSLVI